MKRGDAGRPAAKYARIEDIPGLPHYTETEPGQPRADARGEAARSQAAAARRGRSRSRAQTWRRNAVPFRDLNSKPLIAIVIDDVGIDRPHSKRAWELPGPLTLSFLPYAKDLREQAQGGARAAARS